MPATAVSLTNCSYGLTHARATGRDLAGVDAAGVVGHDQAVGARDGAPALDLLPHIPNDRGSAREDELTTANGTPILVSEDTSTRLHRVSNFKERWLQRFIHQHPTCLPMDQIEPGLGRLVPVCMELPLHGGWVDNLFITPEGHLVVVEVKLWRNPGAHRKVVAQTLEYATALFKLSYDELEAALSKADFNGATRPEGLYSLVDGADAPPESVFASRVSRNLREGRIVVLIVGDAIRPVVDDLMAGLQAHANFHFTFALVEMPVYTLPHSDSVKEYVVVPRTLLKTVDVPRFTIHIKGGSAAVTDNGTDEEDARKPSKQSTISSEQFFEAMSERSPDLPEKLKQFLDEVARIDVRVEYLASLNLKWDLPEGNPVNLGYIRPNGEIWTDASYWVVDEELAQHYNVHLAELFGGKVKKGKAARWVARPDGTPFIIENVANKLSDWRGVIEEFQSAILKTRQNTEI